MPNTMYIEGAPVIECSLFASKALQEMLLQSVNGCIKVFPAVPQEWAEASFGDLRAEGAFLVSAERKQSRTSWIKIESLAGEPCVVKHGMGENFRTTLPKERVTVMEDGMVKLDLKKGETVTLYDSSNVPQTDPEPCLIPPADYNFWGIKNL